MNRPRVPSHVCYTDLMTDVVTADSGANTKIVFLCNNNFFLTRNNMVDSVTT